MSYDLVQGLIKDDFYEEAIGENFISLLDEKVKYIKWLMVNKTTGNNAELIFKERRNMG